MTTAHYMMIIAVALVVLGLVYAKRRGGSGKIGFINFELSEPLEGNDSDSK